MQLKYLVICFGIIFLAKIEIMGYDVRKNV